MNKNFYFFIIALFTTNNKFFCCCDCNCLLYTTYSHAKFKKEAIENGFECVYEENVEFKDQIYLNGKEYLVKKVETSIPMGIDEGDEWNDLDVYCLKINDKIPCQILRKTELSKQNNTNLVIFFHGNGESAFKDQNILLDKIVFEKGYDLLIPELPGYPGNNEGDFSEKIRNEYMEKILEFCKTYYKGQRIVLFGHSLGCYFTTYLASMDEENAVFNKLIIACPFLTDKTAAKYIGKTNTSCCCVCCGECLSECIVTPIYKEKLKNEENIKKVRCNIDILYAPNDSVIDPHDAERLYDILKTKDNRNNDKKNKSGLAKNKQKIRLFPIIPFNYLDWITKRNRHKKIEIFFRHRMWEAIKYDPNATFEECRQSPTVKVKDDFKEAIGEIRYEDINVNFINKLFLEKEIYPFDKKVDHCDVFLYKQIEYFILGYKKIPDLRERKILEIISMEEIAQILNLKN